MISWNSALLWIFLLVEGALASQPLTLHKVSGSRCLDGSDAGYFFRAGSVNNWVIFLDGMGLCFSETECSEMVKDGRGSSGDWALEREDPGGVLSQQPFENPDMGHWNHVLIPACDGTAFVGNKSSHFRAGSTDIWIQGHESLLTIILALDSDHQISKGGRVLLAGSGPGGLAVILNLDSIAATLKGMEGFQGDVVGLSEGAMVPETVDGRDTQAVAMFKTAYKFWEPALPSACDESESWRCLMATNVAHRLGNPIYAVQSTFDCSLLGACNSPAGVEHPDFSAKKISALQKLKESGRTGYLDPHAMQKWETAMRAATRAMQDHATHGMYLIACAASNQLIGRCDGAKALRAAQGHLVGNPVSTKDHSAVCTDCRGWSQHYVRVGCQVISIREGFGDWYFSFPWKGSFAEYTKVIDKLNLVSNPTCGSGKEGPHDEETCVNDEV